MVRPSGWDILGLDGDPTPGVVESVQALAKEFGDFAHDVESACRSLNSFGSDTAALQWVGQTADAFRSTYGPLPGRLQKLYTSYSEASDALSAYAPKLQAAQAKADSALRQAQDAQVDLQRATTSANTAADDLKTTQQNHAVSPNPQAVTDAQTAHDTARTKLNDAKAHMAALTGQANQARDSRISAAKDCAKALHHAQSDGIHNKHWWEHIGADLAEWGGKIAEIANDLSPFLDVLALATSWIPGVDVVTAGLAEADNLIALAGTGLEITGDAMQGHFKDALFGAGMLGLQFAGGRVLGKLGKEGEGAEADALTGAEKDAEGSAGRSLDKKGGIWQVSKGGRNKDFLTDGQQDEARQTALELGMPEDKIIISDNMNTAYSSLFGQDVLYVGLDAYPSTVAESANSLVSMRGGLGHEIVGHREAALAGKQQDVLFFEEAQASLRAAEFTPGLADADRAMLRADAQSRLDDAAAEGIDISEFVPWMGRHI
ncbi:putative T7SS-secreted protein [Catenulispora pinisilvae]|uniref:putative T7SS-secreted protein n=1 Tax=Catenulispora pinisilvae TaxID=2705253 RepID=UPI001E5AB86B|nr:hypothetical protein [Catenulispora pinisilvae]